VPDKTTICYLLTEHMFTSCFRPKDVERLEAELEPVGGPMADADDLPPGGAA
jgi:hypothetical protein